MTRHLNAILCLVFISAFIMLSTLASLYVGTPIIGVGLGLGGGGLGYGGYGYPSYGGYGGYGYPGYGYGYPGGYGGGYGYGGYGYRRRWLG